MKQDTGRIIKSVNEYPTLKAERDKLRNDVKALRGALDGLRNEIHLGKLNIKKDFSLINAHAYASKILRQTKD